MNQPTPAIARRRRQDAPPPVPHLFEVFDCESPLRPPARHSLAGVDEAVLKRGETRSAAREGRTVQLFVPDRFMSTVHARLRRDGDRWRLEDADSKNGTLINGEPCGEAPLADYDEIELGHTHLLFRQRVPEAPGPPDADASDLAEPAAGMRTLVPPFAAEMARLPAIARSSVAVVIGGETGTGKELVARALHQLSGRSGRFVAVNCAAIVDTVRESELFGTRKGAYTGSTESRKGLVRDAEGGTLFLDEIADLSAGSQAALLRVLQEREVLPVGETEPVPVDVRVLAATNADLEAAVSAQKFRADLFARISGFTVRIPPLRWRREDLGLLVASLLERHAPGRARSVKFTCEAARALLRHRWPLNIRELEKCIETALVLADGHPIDLPHLPLNIQRAAAQPGNEPDPGLLDLRPAEAAAPVALSPENARRRQELIDLLQQHRGDVAAVARALNRARMQVYRWARRFDIRLDDFR
jgi:transcriptional regulator with GAF, ATPase, and Fis domain